jgi:hypothetical protein
MPARQIGKPKIPDANAEKMFDAVANGFKHAANLPIDSLLQHNAQTRGRDWMKSRDSGSLAIEKNSPQQFRRECWVPRPIQRHLILLVGLIARMSKPLGKLAIICEKKQPLSLRVQAADIEEPRKFLWEQIKHGVARMLVFSGRNKSRGFMQHDGKRWSDANKFAIDFNMIIEAGLCAEVCANSAVDGDATCRNQLITMSARSDACGREETIEAHRAF